MSDAPDADAAAAVPKAAATNLVHDVLALCAGVNAA